MKQDFDFSSALLAACEVLQLPEIDDIALRKLEKYFLELKHWSRKINLISRGADDRDILEKHFLDSLTLLPFLNGPDPHLLDIGTGAGFPGLVCKAALPELRLTLVEPRLKRVSFLGHVVRTLDLAEVRVLACRVEDEEKLPSALSFTHITSRAVSDLGIFLAMCGRFMKPETRIICMKGPKWQEELDCYLKSNPDCLYSVTALKEYVLPESKSMRKLIVLAPDLSRQYHAGVS